jgi:DNA-binding GntR family transcriptional regulator
MPVAAQTVMLPTSAFVGMDRNSPTPLYFQISTGIEQAIANGDLPPGSRLENEVDLARRLGLSRPTVRRAMQDLVDKGLLVRRRGAGTQVVQGKVTRGLELTSLYEDLANSGQHPTQTLLTHEIVPADPTIAERLDIEVGSPVLRLRRLRSAGGTPVAILENVLPGTFSDLSPDDLQAHGLYQLLRALGVTLSVARQTIGARRATAEEAALLDIEKGGPVMTADRIGYDNSGRAIELGAHCYRPDVYSFEVTLVSK